MREDLNSLLRRTRIISGSILFFYAATHLLNHSLATFSIAAADAARIYFIAFWRNPVAEILLFASFALHILLGVQSVLGRKSFKMTGREWVQMIFPFVALLALIPHVLTTAIMSRLFGVNDNYELIFAATIIDPAKASANVILFSLMVILIWTHGAIGIHGLMKYRPTYARLQRPIMGFFWAVPVLALMGFFSGLKEMSFLTYAHSQLHEDYYMMTLVMKAIPQEAFPVAAMIEMMTMNYIRWFCWR